MVFFINIYLKQYAYQCLLKRKPNYTNLKVIQEYDTFFFIIVTCLFCDDYYVMIIMDVLKATVRVGRPSAIPQIINALGGCTSDHLIHIRVVPRKRILIILSVECDCN